jgi:hypothetical protein
MLIVIRGDGEMYDPAFLDDSKDGGIDPARGELRPDLEEVDEEVYASTPSICVYFYSYICKLLNFVFSVQPSLCLWIRFCRIRHTTEINSLRRSEILQLQQN